MTEFVNLHNHTHYSILDALSSPKDLIKKAKELGQKAIAITDHGTLSSAWTAYKAAKGSGVKLIMGCEMYFLDDVTKTEQKFRHVILLAKNAVGYKNLLSLNKAGFDNKIMFAKRVYPVIDWSLLEKYSEGLICLTSCSNGILAQLLMNKQTEEAELQLNKLINIFGKDNLGLEVQAHTLKRGSNIYNDVIEQVFVNSQIIKLAKKHNLRAVATSNSHYLNKEDAETHDVLLAIGSHQTVFSNFRLKYDCPEFYVKSGDEVKKFFERNYGEYADELCANSVYFADLCEEPVWIDPKHSNPSGKELPEYPVKDDEDYVEFLEWKKSQSEDRLALDEDKLFLRFKCEKTFDAKADPEKLQEYKDRLEEELDVLYFCGVSSYMLIVHDFIYWCRKNNVPVGPGRGSAGGSFVGYLLDIHLADPIKYGLVFPRFFNKLKAAFADIDNDIAKAKRHLVIEYIIKKYGKDKVAAISNVIGMTPKVYVKDISRCCELGGSKEEATKLGMALSDCISADVKNIDSALEQFPLFSEYVKKYPKIANYKAICNTPRSMGMHAAGLVIAARTLHEIVPVRIDKDGMPLVEYDKDVAEENGLVKMDLLGLNTLDIIESTNDLIRLGGREPPVIDYNAYDEKTYELISAGDTFGVFQFGTSGGTIDLCKKIKPKSIEDLAIITTLARPASKEIRDAFIKTRDGKKEVSLLHPSLGRAFEKTYGFPLYDESLLILAKDVAGWDLDEADKLRKLTKEKGKNPEKAKKWRQEFIDGAIKNGLHEIEADKIWEHIVEPFGKYSFNKSHAVLYSFVTFHTAYLKAHFPIEFLLANLMSEVNAKTQDAKKNIDKIKKEIRAHKVKIVPPDINKSLLSYTMTTDRELTTGLDALKFVSVEAIKDIMEKRPFKDFFDFMYRVDSKFVRSNTIQALAASGTLDSFGISRKLMYLHCQDYRKKLQVWKKKHSPEKDTFVYPWPEKEKEWNLAEKFALERMYVGEGFCCGKRDSYGTFFTTGNNVSIASLRRVKDKTQVPSIKAEIKDFFEFKVKKEGSKYQGMSMIKANMEDLDGNQCALTIFPDKWSLVQDRIKEIGGKHTFEVGVALHFAGTVNIYEDELGVILDNLFNFQPIPQVPADLKAKKVSMRSVKTKVEKEDSEEPNNLDNLFEELEDSLYEEGLIELDDEEYDY